MRLIWWLGLYVKQEKSDAFLSEDFQNSTTINAMEKNNNRIFHSWAYTICSEMATWLSEAICFTENYKFKFVN